MSQFMLHTFAPEDLDSIEWLVSRDEVIEVVKDYIEFHTRYMVPGVQYVVHQYEGDVEVTREQVMMKLNGELEFVLI